MERRLTTILAADAAGYSRLMERDEEATLAALTEHREELIAPQIAGHHGRIVKLMGDGALVEFDSVVDAVACAVAVQAGMAERNADVPEDRRIIFRIGIHLGDVMVEEGDLYGDGVNVAARLETLAEPGGICVSQQVLDQVETKLALDFEDLGEQEVKNISRPIRVYRVPDRRGAPRPAAARRSAAGRRPGIAVVAGTALIAAVGLAAWLQPWKSGAQNEAQPAVASAAREKPAIAVLPFANISGAADQDYFSDGMTEDLITDLSKISGLTVISRTTTSGYKGRDMDVREVGQALNVKYVIEGSVRKAGEQVRINAQLIDASTGVQIWADRYDGSLDDVFTLQDRVLDQIVGSLALTLSGEERRQIAARGTDSMAAHDLYLRGLYNESSFSRDGNRAAMRLYQEALAIDPDYALPYAQMANLLEMNARSGWSDDVRADLEMAVKLAEKAVALDPRNARVYWSLGRASARLRTPGALERGVHALERAIELDPDFADAYAYLAVLYMSDGRAADGLKSVEAAMELNPTYPFWYLLMRGMSLFFLQEYDLAIDDFEAALEKNPTVLILRWWLAASYAKVGRMEDAEWQVDELFMAGFEGNISTIMDTQPIQHPDYLDAYRDGLRKAGIPE